MAFTVQPEAKGARSGSLTVDLSSNNPFRNRLPSPAPPARNPSPLNSQAPPRPISRNPFLDASSESSLPPAVSNMSHSTTSTTRNPLLGAGDSEDLFGSLTLNEKPNPKPMPMQSSNRSRPATSRAATDRSARGASRPENVPPNGPSHRPSRSQEEAMRTRRAQNGTSRSRGELDIFADPSEARLSPERSRTERSDRERRRPRRNSDTSVMERKPLDAEEEKKKRDERRRRERERRHKERDAAKKDGGEKRKDGKPKPRKLDVIDQLDATSIYGTGLFHHDGPFDACNPNRNKAGRKNAPMQAFPKDSLNNVLGGSGPLNKTPDHATFLGNHDNEAFTDYHTTTDSAGVYSPFQAGPPPAKTAPVVEAFTTKFEPVHGAESMGLGTSTFLEGAPASRKAMQRRESDTTYAPEQGGGLGRKKSMAQKIRGISNSGRRDFGPSGRMTSPEGVFVPSPDVITPGGTARKGSEANPFFNEFEPSKGESITFVEPANRPTRAGAPSSPGSIPGHLQRRATSDSSRHGEVEQKPMGFLSRVKSLKGGRRAPPPPRENRPMPAAPGQAI